MVKQLLEYTEDTLALYQLCRVLGQFSACKDKQVGAVLTDDDNIPLSFGYNLVKRCNDECNKTCSVVHAEVAACNRLASQFTPTRAYINLFPCMGCQLYLSEHGVKEVFVFGQQGNKEYYSITGLKIYLLPNLPQLLLEYNGPRNTRAVVQGECAELITAISNYDARTDRAETKEDQRLEIVKEYIDVRLQSEVLQRSLPMYELKMLEVGKWNKLIAKFKDKFFPDKNL